MRISNSVKTFSLVAGAVVLGAMTTGCQAFQRAESAPQPEPIATSTPNNPTPNHPVPGNPVQSNPVTQAPIQNRGDQRFVLINDRPLSMFYFYASPNNNDSWENDILGNDVLPSGASITVNINDNRQDCLYDFRAIFEDGSEGESYRVNICELSTYTFN